MKLLLVVFDAVFSEEVHDALHEARVPGWTLWEKALGKGSNSDPRLDDGVWPGFNQVLMVIAEEPTLRLLSERLKDLRKTGRIDRISVYALPVEELL